jgi:hypothetical protein
MPCFASARQSPCRRSVRQEVAVSSKDKVPFVPVGTIYLLFKPGEPDDVKQGVLDKYALQIVAPEPDGFLSVRVTTPRTDFVEVATKLQRKKCVAVAEPDLLTWPKCEVPPGSELGCFPGILEVMVQMQKLGMYFKTKPR